MAAGRPCYLNMNVWFLGAFAAVTSFSFVVLKIKNQK